MVNPSFGEACSSRSSRVCCCLRKKHTHTHTVDCWRWHTNSQHQGGLGTPNGVGGNVVAGKPKMGMTWLIWACPSPYGPLTRAHLGPGPIWAPSPYGPRAHLGPGPFGPRAHMGPGPYQPCHSHVGFSCNHISTNPIMGSQRGTHGHFRNGV